MITIQKTLDANSNPILSVTNGDSVKYIKPEMSFGEVLTPGSERWGFTDGEMQSAATGYYAETVVLPGLIGDSIASKKLAILTYLNDIRSFGAGGGGGVSIEQYQVNCEIENDAHGQTLGFAESDYYVANLVFSDDLTTLGITDWKAATCCQTLTFELHNADVPNFALALFNPGASSPAQTRALVLIMKGDGANAYFGVYRAVAPGVQTFPIYTPALDSGATVVDADLTAQGWILATADTLFCQPTLAVALQESDQLSKLRGAIGDIESELHNDLTYAGDVYLYRLREALHREFILPDFSLFTGFTALTLALAATKYAPIVINCVRATELNSLIILAGGACLVRIQTNPTLSIAPTYSDIPGGSNNTKDLDPANTVTVDGRILFTQYIAGAGNVEIDLSKLQRLTAADILVVEITPIVIATTILATLNWKETP